MRLSSPEMSDRAIAEHVGVSNRFVLRSQFPAKRQNFRFAGN